MHVDGVSVPQPVIGCTTVTGSAATEDGKNVRPRSGRKAVKSRERSGSSVPAQRTMVTPSGGSTIRAVSTAGDSILAIKNAVRTGREVARNRSNGGGIYQWISGDIFVAASVLTVASQRTAPTC